MYSPAKENFLRKNKRFFIWVIIFYVCGSVMGIILFHSPDFSKGHLQKYTKEHELYREVIKNPEYNKYIERPHLFKGTPEELEKFQTVKDYEQKADFQAEERRILLYLLWFKTLNIISLFVLVFHFGWIPLLKYINKYQRDILDKRNKVDNLHRQTVNELSESEKIYKTLPDVIKEKEFQKEVILKEQLSKIEEQNRLAKEQIEFLLETKKREEILNCINNMKRLLIEEACKEVEEKLAASENSESLAQTVEKFNFLITMLS